jgi:hypothetical protein
MTSANRLELIDLPVPKALMPGGCPSTLATRSFGATVKTAGSLKS